MQQEVPPCTTNSREKKCLTAAAPAEAGRSPLPSSVFCPLVLLSLSLTSPPLLQAKAHMQIDFPVQMRTAWNIPLASMS